MDYDGNGAVHPTATRNRVRRVVRGTGNGTSGSARYPNDMATQIHHYEQEAYISVLRAFKVQSDALTWEKAKLMTDLRTELRISNEEHRAFLNRVDKAENKKNRVDEDNGNWSPFHKKQKISLVSGNRGVAGHALRNISSIESAQQYYSTGTTRKGNRRAVRGVRKSMDHDGAVLPLQSPNGDLDQIQMVLTKAVVNEVENILLLSNPEPFEIERAVNLLKSQEETLVDALAKITSASEGESESLEANGNSHEPSMGREQELTDKQLDINGPPALSAENGMMTEEEGGGNGEEGSHESSKAAA
ncbi:hypothetical protein MKW92_006485 [Papaver armeniacum]|nr:hypothetical protein MKW92_006485 [Papaver armeniacum]